MKGLENLDINCSALLTSVFVGLACGRYIGNRYFVKDFTLLDNLMFRLLGITSLSGEGRGGRRDTGGGGGDDQ